MKQALIGGLTLAFVPVLAWALNEDAQGQAARLCYEQGLPTGSAAFDACVASATRAIESGQPQLARAQARTAADADGVCRSYGIEPQSLGYRHCLAAELQRTGQAR
jgi:hypothetical protein